MAPRRKSPLTPEQRRHLFISFMVVLAGYHFCRLASGDLSALVDIAEIALSLWLT